MKQAQDKIPVACYTLMAFLTELAIAHGDTTLYPMWMRKIYVYLIFLCLVTAIIFIIPKLKQRFDATVFLPILFFYVTTTYTCLGTSFGDIYTAFYNIFRLGGYLCLGYVGQIKVYKNFKLFMVVMSVLGIIAFLSYVLHLPIPYRNVDFYNDSFAASYVDYGFAFLFSEYGAVRLCGLFNEPGAFGTLLGFLLCADNYNLKDRKNIILFIAACMTFSVAFVAISILFLLLKVRKQPHVIIPIIVAGVFLIIMLVSFASDNPIVQVFIERFSFEDGLLSMDDRTNDKVDKVFQAVIGGENFFWGYGTGYLHSTDVEDTGSTYKTVIIDYGVLGFIILYGFVILAALKKSKKNIRAINFVVCFALSIYQRPNIYTLVHFVVLFGGIQYILSQSKNLSIIKKKDV